MEEESALDRVGRLVVQGAGQKHLSLEHKVPGKHREAGEFVGESRAKVFQLLRDVCSQRVSMLLDRSGYGLGNRVGVLADAEEDQAGVRDPEFS